MAWMPSYQVQIELDWIQVLKKKKKTVKENDPTSKCISKKKATETRQAVETLHLFSKRYLKKLKCSLPTDMLATLIPFWVAHFEKKKKKKSVIDLI